MHYAVNNNERRRKSLKSPGPPNLLLCDANTFADVLGVSPSYRQKESQRWNSAMNIYKRLSSQDLSKTTLYDYIGNSPSTTPADDTSAPISPVMSPTAASAKRNSAPAPFDPRMVFNVRYNKNSTPPPRESSSSSSIARNRIIRVSTIVDDEEFGFNVQRRCASSFDLADPGTYGGGRDGRGRSADLTGAENESSLNALELEAIAAVHELQFAVRDIFVSELLPRTGHLIFLNVTTAEGQPFCVELTVKGWRVTSLRHDCMNGDLDFIDLHIQYFETVYALMDAISPSYKLTFSKALAHKLQSLLVTDEEQTIAADAETKVLFNIGKEKINTQFSVDGHK